MSFSELWPKVEAAQRAYPDHYYDKMNAAADQFGLQAPDWNPLLGAISFEPDPISVRRLRIRSPYSSPRYFGKPLAVLHEQGFLEESELLGYFLTDRGREAASAILSSAYDGMQSIQLLDHSEMERLSGALGRLSQFCLLAKIPVSKWSIIYTRRLDGAPPTSYSAKLDQYLSDIYSFRDDAHLASWVHHGVTGHEWDILTVIWREELQSIEQVAKRLERRQWTKDETQEALRGLQSRGWIHDDPQLGVTEAGRAAREEAEQMTDQYFFTPWQDLSQSDSDAITKLVPKLLEKLEES